LAAAETAADFAVLLETMFQPDELDAAEPFSTLEIQKRMMTALPNNAKASQLKSEHPNATFEAFHKTLINEQARPVSMPYNKAACDSSSYNYASGRLDHQTQVLKRGPKYLTRAPSAYLKSVWLDVVSPLPLAIKLLAWKPVLLTMARRSRWAFSQVSWVT
jgi:hypothetical protein